jgi:hypothetical protein
MMIHSLLKASAWSVASTGAAAAQTAVNGSSVDMQAAPGPFENATGVALLGTLTATQVTYLKAQGSDDNSTWADLASTKTGPAADADGGKLLVLDLFRPQHRYIRFVLVRGTANAVLTAMLQCQYNGQREPISQLAAQVSASNFQSLAVDGTP